MKRNKIGNLAKENLAITEQKKYQRKIKVTQEEQQTQLREKKKLSLPEIKAKHIVNKQWHASHKMPKYPTLQQRIDWHLEHAKHCGCRTIPTTVIEEMEKRGIAIKVIV